MNKLLAKYWFFLGIVVVFVLAFKWPGAGAVMKEWSLLNVGIFLCFLITGLTLPGSDIIRAVRDFRGVFGALISTFILFPIVAITLARICFPDNDGFIAGVCILAVAPVTIASGAVMTRVAQGNVPLSLIICVVANFLAIFTVPVSLSLVLEWVLDLDKSIDLSVLSMIWKLLRIVFFPTLMGQILRIWIKDQVGRWSKVFSIFSQGVVLLIILNAASLSRNELRDMRFGAIGILLFTVVLHGVILLLNLLLAKTMRLNRPSVAAFTIHVSQKTLTISSVVWADYLADDYPLALIPVAAYHLTQMIADTFVAHKFSEQAGKGRIPQEEAS